MADLDVVFELLNYQAGEAFIFVDTSAGPIGSVPLEIRVLTFLRSA
jgi:hypothetical protein